MKKLSGLYMGLILVCCCMSDVLPQTPANRSIAHVKGSLYVARNNSHSTAFLVTAEGIILSDPISREFSSWLKMQFQDQFGLPVRFVVYSHSDADHASGGEIFADTAEFVGHANMRTGLPQGVHAPTIYYQDSHEVRLGGRTVKLVHPGPAHSDNMSIILFPDEDALFVVDFISIQRLPYRDLSGYELELWLSEIRTVEAFSTETVIPGHGPVGSMVEVVEFRHYVERLRDAVATALDEGQSLAQMKARIRLDDYRDWASYEAWRELNIEGMFKMLSGQR